MHSCCPCIFGILAVSAATRGNCSELTDFQRMTFSAGRYFALPIPTLTSAFVVLRGVGMRRTTLVSVQFAVEGRAKVNRVFDTRFCGLGHVRLQAER